jgi:hypothetical protein
LILAPFCSNNFITSKWPSLDAFINGVNPSISYSIKEKKNCVKHKNKKEEQRERIENHFLNFMIFFRLFPSFFLSLLYLLPFSYFIIDIGSIL